MQKDQSNNLNERPPRRWALVAWPKETGAGYLLLPGRYETMAGAILASDVAAMKHKRTMQIVEVAGAGPDEQSGANEQYPGLVVRSGAWVGEAGAALEHATNAAHRAGLEGHWAIRSTLEKAVRALREALGTERPPSPTV